MGGKTGTAQVAISGHYDASKTIASFIGFAPVAKPKFIGLIVLDQPKSSIKMVHQHAFFIFLSKDRFLVVVRAMNYRCSRFRSSNHTHSFRH
jgi:hypothetical protein